jgi:hypothetical protein
VGAELYREFSWYYVTGPMGKAIEEITCRAKNCAEEKKRD